jgi:ribosomal protein L11 methylase PrmA|tara:strand:- start:256 stop:1653 length:1398 start_codon:yes stop_codon:yes gene_type:complete
VINFKYENGSFRDPAGTIFYKDKKVFRQINKSGLERYRHLKESKILEESIEKKFLIATRECEDKSLLQSLQEAEIILEHDLIEYVSYPYEWCFYQLKDAALLHLNFQLFLLEKNSVLIDSSAYNIQFIGCKPIFIDVLSIDKYKEGMYWTGHKQFCENFLNPLLLSSKKNINFNNWFKGNLEGILTSDLNSILSFKDKFSINIFLQVYLLDKLENKAIENPKKTLGDIKKIKPFVKKSYRSLLLQIKKMIERLEPNTRSTVWGKYSENNTYSNDNEKIKINIVKDFINKNKFNLLADIGCNNGLYSFESLKSGCQNVVGFDYDLNALNNAFLKSKNNKTSFLPLYFDASNPSANIGWHERERKGFKERLNFDGMIALAFEHHLAIFKNIPLDQTISWLINVAPKGLIEFVPKDDETVQSMLLLKGDIFPNYSEKNFKSLMQNKVNIINVTEVGTTGRKIYEYEKK